MLGSGFVNVFNPDGTFVRRIESDQFASPWGLALAPDEFGEFANALLIGNFNDEFGFINAFDPSTGTSPPGSATSCTACSARSAP